MAHRLETFLKKKRIRQRRFAQTVGISAPYLSMILSGARRPGPEVARRISKATGIPLESLLFPSTKGRKDAA